MAVELLRDPYEVLGLVDGTAATPEAEIRKARASYVSQTAGALTRSSCAQAYRKQALARHPDKRPALEREGACAATPRLASALSLNTLAHSRSG